MNPLRRKTNVYVERLPDEAVIYDKVTHRSHCVNMTVLTIWENADGTKTVSELARLLEDKFGMPLSRDVVLLALEDLQQANLLETTASLPTGERLPSRREVGRKLALAGISASFLPFIASVIAPTPAMARSYTAQNYGQEVGQTALEIKKEFGELYMNKNGSFTDYKAALSDGAAGLTATGKGNTSLAQTDFKNAEEEFNDMLKALGLPPL